MPAFLNQTNMVLKERLRLHTGFTVALRGEGSISGPAALERVGKQFIRVSGRLFVPHALDEIALSGFEPEIKGAAVLIRTTARGKFQAQLLRTGEDFIEFLIDRANGQKDWLLVPLNKVISLEPLGDGKGGNSS